MFKFKKMNLKILLLILAVLTVGCSKSPGPFGAGVNISLDPAFHGKGLGSELLKLSIIKLWLAKDIKLIEAYVKKDNIASIKLFEKCLFTADVEKELL